MLARTSPPTESATLLGASRAQADRLNGLLLLGHFPVALFLAATYGGWALALLIGGPISATSVALSRLRPGASATRLWISVAYMLYSALFIQLAHGMTEMHFHVFAALALLLVYRDRRLPIVSAVVVSLHHLAFLLLQQRGAGVYVMPMAMPGTAGLSMIGVHVLFVVFESVTLSIMARRLEQEATQTQGVFRALGELGWRTPQPDVTGPDVVDALRTVIAAIRALDRCGAELSAAVVEQRPAHFRDSHQLYGAFLDVASHMQQASDRLQELRDRATIASGHLRDANQTLAAETARASALAERADSANRAKSEFLANMSHEIRTPLTAILGFTDMLREQGDDPALTRQRSLAIETIHRAGQHLLAVINDVLDVSKIEAGRLIIEDIDTDLPGLLADIAVLMTERAHAKHVALRVTLLTPIPARVRTDATRLRQILTNLVGNAVKFTDDGVIDVRALWREEETVCVLRVEIEDTGPGMTASQAHALFQPFAQADASVTRRHGGTGLGLTISRRLAQLLGGDVLLEYTMPGLGSRFVVELPMRALHEATFISTLGPLHTSDAAPVVDPASLPRLHGRILLAEDGEDNQRLIAYHLRNAGAEVTIAGNGRIALALLHDAARTATQYDLLVTDMQMPELDGYTLARTLRAEGNALPIIALTAHAMSEDRQHCLDAGCDDYATKPVNRAELIRCCARWLDTVVTTSEIFPSSAPEPGMLRSDLWDEPEMRDLVMGFVGNLPQRVAQLESHAARGNWSDVARVAHQLKGAAGGYGFAPVSDAARVLETCCVTWSADHFDADAGVDGTSERVDDVQSDDGDQRRREAFEMLVTTCRAAMHGHAISDRSV